MGTTWASEVQGLRAGHRDNERMQGQTEQEESAKWRDRQMHTGHPPWGLPECRRPRAQATRRAAWRRRPFPGLTYLNGFPSGVLGGEQLVTLAVQLVNSLLFGLQVPVDEILQQGQWRGSLSSQAAPCSFPAPWPAPPEPSAHLVLAPAAGVVEVAVAPVILHAALGLLVQPVQLIGAALHVVLQRAQVLLPCLRRRLWVGTDRAVALPARASLHASCSTALPWMSHLTAPPPRNPFIRSANVF